MSDPTKIRRRTDVLWRTTPGFLVVSTVEGTALQATGPAAAIWELLDDATTMDALAEELARRHHTDVDRVRSDIGPFIDQLIDEGYVERLGGSDE